MAAAIERLLRPLAPSLRAARYRFKMPHQLLTLRDSVVHDAGSTSLCAAVLSGGVAACGATNAPVGPDTVTGTYSGGDGYASSSGTATLTVTKA